jgi:hypothetical protein
MRGPRLAGFRRDLRETHARGRIGNADQVLAGGALNLSAGEMRFALQRLVTVGTIEFEFGGVHSFYLHKRNPPIKSMAQVYPYFLAPNFALSVR